MKKFAILLFVLPLLASCQDITAMQARVGLAAPAPLPPPPDPAAQVPALERRLAVLVAEQRLKLDPGRPALALDPELSDVARARAADMAQKNYLAHAAPNGDTSATLLMAADDKFQGLLGENLAAQHYTKLGGIDPDAFAQRFLDTWLNSTPHRENLAFPEYSRTGVGVAINADTVYVALLFASDLGTRKPGDASVTSLNHPGDAKQPLLPSGPPPPLRMRGAIGAGQ